MCTVFCLLHTPSPVFRKQKGWLNSPTGDAAVLSCYDMQLSVESLLLFRSLVQQLILTTVGKYIFCASRRRDLRCTD